MDWKSFHLKILRAQHAKEDGLRRLRQVHGHVTRLGRKDASQILTEHQTRGHWPSKFVHAETHKQIEATVGALVTLHIARGRQLRPSHCSNTRSGSQKFNKIKVNISITSLCVS